MRVDENLAELEIIAAETVKASVGTEMYCAASLFWSLIDADLINRLCEAMIDYEGLKANDMDN